MPKDKELARFKLADFQTAGLVTLSRVSLRIAEAAEGMGIFLRCAEVGIHAAAMQPSQYRTFRRLLFSARTEID